MSEIAEIKQRLRDDVLSRRNAVSTANRALADERIKEFLQQLPEYKNAQKVFCYVSVESEVNTRELIEEMLEEGKLVCSPRCEGKGVMYAHQIFSVEELKGGILGIPTPDADAPLVDPAEIDLILLPGLSCTKEGYRLGYGGGYYDRYLVKAPNAAKIMFCREGLLLPELPVESHDVPADIVITDKEVFDTRSVCV